MMFNRGRAGRWVGLLLALSQGCAAMAADEAESTVEKCGKSFGTLAVAEPQTGWGHLQQYGLGSPAVLLRVMIQKSGCFDVVERGVAMQNLQQERAMMNAGDLRADSNVGQGQMQAADFVLSPTVQIGAQNTGGIGGGLLSRFGVLGAIAGGLKFKEASTSLTIADVRSSLQVAAAEGKASKTDFSLGGFAGGIAAGGYTSSPEGKVVAASFLDNYNKIVVEIRDKPQLIKPSSAAGDANAAQSTRAEAPMKPGQLLSAKIGNVKVYAEPSRESAVVGTLQRGEEAVASGETKNGFALVDTSGFSGWVQRTLVAPIAGGAPQATPQSAVQPLPLPMGSSAGMRYGSFAGTMDGADKGNLRILINNQGTISGNGAFANAGAFGVAGQFEAEKGDQVTFMASSSVGNLVFIGNLDRARGEISGSWMVTAGLMPALGAYNAANASKGGGGSFRVLRQP